jgi:hypothetical protein
MRISSFLIRHPDRAGYALTDLQGALATVGFFGLLTLNHSG